MANATNIPKLRVGFRYCTIHVDNGNTYTVRRGSKDLHRSGCSCGPPQII